MRRWPSLEQDRAQRGQEVAVCHVCERLFATQLSLSEHLMKDHDEDLLPDHPGEMTGEAS